MCLFRLEYKSYPSQTDIGSLSILNHSLIFHSANTSKSRINFFLTEPEGVLFFINKLFK